MKRALVFALLLVGALAHAEELEAPRARQGWYEAVGPMGVMSLAREDGATLGPMGGLALEMRSGEMLTPRLGIGLSSDFGFAAGDNQRATLIGIGIAGQYEVLTNLAVHATIGLGIVGLKSDADDPDGDVRGVTGTAYTAGISYDIFFTHPQSGGWALTPSLWLRAVPGGTDAFTMFAGIQITHWSGLTKNQLALPPGEGY